MIKELQKKFIFTAMTAITVLIVIIIGAINIFNCVVIDSQTDRTLEFLAQRSFEPVFSKPDAFNKGMFEKNDIFDRPMDEDTFMASRCFTVYLTEENEILRTDVSRISSVNEETATNIAREMLQNGKYYGICDNFKFTTAIVDTVVPITEDCNSVMVFLDITDQFYNMLSVLVLSAIIAVVAWVLMLLLVIALSKKAIRPIAENMEQQKKFITNAGHEIKTPLAIILANTDALELHNGENKWSNNIRTQTNRLSGLMQNLLMLSKMDESAGMNVKRTVNASDVLKETIEPYFELSEKDGKKLICNIEENVVVSEVPDSLRQLFAVLVDNAVKYASPDTDININLYKNAGKTVFKIKNTCEKLPDVEPKKLFDRFYRGDSARTQIGGGYGIGLSVAAAVTEANKGKITAQYPDGNQIEFTVEM